LTFSCTNSNLILYNCEEEICYPINGYLKCGSNLFICDIKNCKIYENENNECDSENIDFPYIDENSKLKFCIGSYNYYSKWKEIENSEASEYIFSYDRYNGYIYHLYITYFYGNIISWSNSSIFL